MLDQCSFSQLRERVRLLEKALEQEKEKTAEALRSAEKIRFFYDAMFENMNDGVAVYEAVNNGADFVFTAFNRSAEKLEHISRTEVIGRRVTEAFPGVEAFGLLDVFRRVLHTGLPEYFPLRDYRDERLHAWRTNYVFRLPGGEVVAIYRDETERVRAEQALQESERKFRLLFEEAPVGYQSLDEKGNFREVNQAWLNILGYARNEVIGRNFSEFLVPEWQDHFRENFPRFKAVGEILGVEFEMVKKDGSRILVAFNGKIGKKADGTFRQTHCILHNITEQRQAEENIIRSEREKEAILNGLRDVAVGYINRDMYFMWGNEALYNIIRCSPEEIGQKTCYEMIYGRTSPCEDCPVIRAFETGEYQETEKQGKENRFYLMRSNPVRNSDDEIVGVVHASMDITERRNAEESLKWELMVNRALASLSEALLSSGWNIEDIAWLVLHHALNVTGSRNGYTSFIDSAGANILIAFQGETCPSGKRAFYPDANGKYAALWGHSLNTQESFYTNSPQDHPASVRTPPGHTVIERLLSVPVKLDGKVAGQILLANPPHDYTPRALHAVEQIGELYALALQRKHFDEDRKKLQKQLQQSQKMEAIGVLAGGIAHDFNNLLFPIIGYTEMLLETAPDEAGILHPLEEILGAARRAKELVWQILTFSRQAEQERRPVQLQNLLKEVLQLIRASLPSTIRIETRIENDCGPVLADPSQLHSIAMNLFTNAFHAMQENGGRLGVTLREIRLETPDLKGFSIKPGLYVCLSVSDTGCGMTKTTLDRIFDPYFTTKSPEKGTGLGLAVVHGIVRNYGGDIRVYSEPGTGTVFHVYLPRIITPELHQEVKIRQTLLRGSERVMLVDDEPQVLDVAAQMLEHLGYTVTRFTRPQVALEHFEEAAGDFDLVMTDMTMPEMTGDLLVRRVMAIRPGIPVILCTGFSERIDRESAKAIGIREFLMKPVTLSELSQTVRHALDGKD